VLLELLLAHIIDPLVDSHLIIVSEVSRSVAKLAYDWAHLVEEIAYFGSLPYLTVRWQKSVASPCHDANGTSTLQISLIFI